MADEDPPPTTSRPRRQNSRIEKKRSILEKVRELKGRKNKYEVGELENVYEEVDEREYTKKVISRQEDDWIVDDDGSGYIEDGREIFDDDLDEESISKSKNQSTGKKRSRSSIEPHPEGRKGNIRNMIINMPAKKKKETDVKLDEDDILGDIIGEIDAGKDKPKKTYQESMKATDYIKSLSVKVTKPTPETPVNRVTTAPKTTSSGPVFHKAKVPEKVPLSSIENSLKSAPGDKPDDDPILIEPTEEPILLAKIKEEPVDVDEEPMEIPNEPIDIPDFEDDPFDGVDTETASANAGVVKCEKDAVTNNQEIKLSKVNGAVEEIPTEFGEWNDNTSEESGSYVQVDKNILPLTTNQNGQEVFSFYYLDAHEAPMQQPGTVYLFGKVWIESARSYVSCCVPVKNIDRQIFLLPREKRVDVNTGKESDSPIKMTDVYEEFNTTITSKYKIKQFRSRKVVKKYCFNKPDVPLESEYLEVRYSASCPALPSDLSGETFSCVFGAKTSFLETLLLEKGIKGPGWIEIQKPEVPAAPVSWCKIEAICTAPGNLIVVKAGTRSDVPPMVLVTIVPQTVFVSKSRHAEIVAISVLTHDKYPADKQAPDRLFNNHFCLLTRPSDVTWPFDAKIEIQKFKKTHIEKVESERALLNLFLAKLYRIDPDIVIGHNLSGYGIDIIVERLAFHKVPNWSRLGRLKRAILPQKGKQNVERIAMTGRLLCDVKISAKELIKSRSYDLNDLCQNILHMTEDKVVEFSDEDFRSAYSSGTSLCNAVWVRMSDAYHILKMFKELNILPLAIQITTIAGNVLSRTLSGGRSERNEFLLLHAFHAKGYIVPDKEYAKKAKKEEDLIVDDEDGAKKSHRKKPTYAGGLVLEPKIGFYDTLILLMDFNSLYPSIIQEYNICFTTIPTYSISMDDDFTENLEQYFPDKTVETGVLPTEIRKLVESRRDVKKLLKASNLHEDIRMQYEIRQMALKLTANSMYGCLGFAQSRFFAKPLAALVTAKGREILLSTKNLVESFDHEVIYGDTDSIMIDTKTKDFDSVYQIGKKIKNEVNKCYRQVELDIDGVFKFMLLLRKKKYAAVTLTKLPNGELLEKRELKGLDIVRRDWSQLASVAGNVVLSEILKAQSNDDRVDNIHHYLSNLKEDLENDKIPLNILCITKQLTKAPEDYSNSKGLSHVQVALRLNSKSARRFRQGDTISYIICEDGTNNPPTQRAYHIEELRNNDTLKIDVKYYLAQQIHAVVSRLCDPIEGTDAASIARCLGLDPATYAQRIRDTTEADDVLTIFTKDTAERFKHCDRFKFKCPAPECGTENVIEGLYRILENGNKCLSLDSCVNPKCDSSPLAYLLFLQNSLQLTIREHVKKYAQSWLMCSDPSCCHRTRTLPLAFEGAYPLCPTCKNSPMRKEYSCLQLYNQIYFYSTVFDLNKVISKKVTFDKDITEAYRDMFEIPNEFLKRSKYSVINLDQCFAQIFNIVKKEN